MIPNVDIEGRNAEGFIGLDALRKRARSDTRETFLATFPLPVLHVVDIQIGSAAGDGDATVRSGPRLAALLDPGRSAFRYLDLVGFLAKRPGNPFPNFVSVGRAATNDLVLGLETVSKVHGYFTVADGRWFVTDYRSMNGIRVNGVRLEPGTAGRVADGDRILFGTEVTVVFLTPETLHSRLVG